MYNTTVLSGGAYKNSAEWEKQLEKRRRSSARKALLFKWVASIVCGVIAAIPTILFLLIKSDVGAVPDFWAKLALWGVGLFFFGTSQVILIIIFIAVLVMIWD